MVIEVDPAGLIAAVHVGPREQVLGAGQGPGGRSRVACPGVGPGFDQPGERQHPRHSLPLGAFEDTLGHIDGLAGEAPQQCLHGHRGQHIAAKLDIAGSTGEAKGLDEVPLGGLVLTDVERRPSSQPGQLGGDGEQMTADIVGEGSPQQRGRALAQAGGDRTGLPVSAAIPGVPVPGLVGGLAELVEVGLADTLSAEVVGGLVGRGDQPAGHRGGEGGHGEAGSGEEVTAVHKAPEGSGGADGVGGLSREIQPHIRSRCLRLTHTDLKDTDGTAEPFADRLGQQAGHRRLRSHAAAAPVRDGGVRIGRFYPGNPGELVNAPSQGLVARSRGFDEPGQVRVRWTAPADGRSHDPPPLTDC